MESVPKYLGVENGHFFGDFPQIVGDSFADLTHFPFNLAFVVGLESLESERAHDAVAYDQGHEADVRHEKSGNIPRIIHTLSWFLRTGFRIGRRARHVAHIHKIRLPHTGDPKINRNVVASQGGRNIFFPPFFFGSGTTFSLFWISPDAGTSV